MERAEFTQNTRDVFRRIVDVLDEHDPDVVEAEYQGDILKILFATGSPFILNTQSAAHQIWLAGAARGWHFDWDASGEAWVCAKNGDELFGTLAEMVTARLGETVEF